MDARMRYGIGAIVAIVAIAAVGFQARQTRVVTATAAPAEERTGTPFYDNLGSFERRITTSVADAQRYFDQGLRLTYAFNHAEALRAFQAATTLDPECAMCYWGIAYAYGPNINAPMDSASEVAAYGAIVRAQALADHAGPAERALIDALALRYSDRPAADRRAALDATYAVAMRTVRDRFSDDNDVLTLHAEAVMNLRPWDYWERDGNPRPGTAELVADLERVLLTDPNHPGACHYYIHAVEAVAPQKAVACAERLASLMPGAGHLVHMPAHIYIRVGRWADAITANEHAVHSDETYIADQGPTGVYPIAYYPHNYHFLSFAATMAGRADMAISAARSVVQHTPADIARAVPPVEPLVAYAHLALVTFGRWDDVLNEPVPPQDLEFATALAQYARGVAHAAKGQADQARAALQVVQTTLQGVAGDPLGAAVLDIAQHSLAGEIAFRANDLRGAEAHFRQAMTIEDQLLYMEPPHWYYPVRHSLGAVLMRAGRHADAERVYREDLERFPENVWSLHGLALSLRAQGRQREAAAVDARRPALGSTIELTASRF
jgi:tetratricopeptide (TPR) repeat protein